MTNYSQKQRLTISHRQLRSHLSSFYDKLFNTIIKIYSTSEDSSDNILNVNFETIPPLNTSHDDQSYLILRKINSKEFLFKQYRSNIHNCTTTLYIHPNKANKFNNENRKLLHIAYDDAFKPAFSSITDEIAEGCTIVNFSEVNRKISLLIEIDGFKKDKILQKRSDS